MNKPMSPLASEAFSVGVNYMRFYARPRLESYRPAPVIDQIKRVSEEVK